MANKLETFMVQHRANFALGIIGGSSNTKLSSYGSFLYEACYTTKRSIGNFAIVCGGTKGGIPELALDIANQLRIPSIGVFPENGAKHAMLSKVDFPIAVPSPIYGRVKWTSETPTLAGIPNLFFLVAGGWGTLAEVTAIMKTNQDMNRNGSPVIPIATKDSISRFHLLLKLIRMVMPAVPGTLEIVSRPQQLSKLMIKYANHGKN